MADPIFKGQVLDELIEMIVLMSQHRERELIAFYARWPHVVKLHHDYDFRAPDCEMALWCMERFEPYTYEIMGRRVGFEDADAAFEFKVRWK